MAFFPRTLYNTDASFTPLFRLLDDFDNYSRQGQGQGCRRAAVPTWQPKFDVRESGDFYELHGELPGIGKEDVHIEFTEPQTLLIRGKSERPYHATSSNGELIEDTPVSGAITEDDEKSKISSHQATVEDEYESIAHESAGSEVEDPKEEAPEVQEQPKKQAVDNAKYWLTERSFGEFSRTFNFPTRVDQDTVSASFKDGVLSITVPKAKKHESRRIAVN